MIIIDPNVRLSSPIIMCKQNSLHPLLSFVVFLLFCYLLKRVFSFSQWNVTWSLWNFIYNSNVVFFKVVCSIYVYVCVTRLRSLFFFHLKWSVYWFSTNQLDMKSNDIVIITLMIFPTLFSSWIVRACAKCCSFEVYSLLLLFLLDKVL